jgi:hypothetical protein
MERLFWNIWQTRGLRMAKFETVSIGELKHSLPAKLLPLVEEYREKLEELTAEQGGRLTLEESDDAKELRRALRAATAAINQCGRRRGLRSKAEAVGGRERGGGPRKGG